MRRRPLRAEALGLELWGAPPPSSGGAAILFASAFVGGYGQPLAAAGVGLAAHRTVEAFKHAFALRMSMGDPAFWQNDALLADMLDAQFVAALRANTSDWTTQPPQNYGGSWNQLRSRPPEDHGTTHVSVVDQVRIMMLRACFSRPDVFLILRPAGK